MSDENIHAAFDRARRAVEEWTQSNLAIGGVCDFCSAPTPLPEGSTFVAVAVVTTLAALDVDTLHGAILDIASDEFWLACDGCAPEVRKGDAEHLAQYVLDHRHPRTGTLSKQARPHVHRQLIMLYQTLFDGGLTEVPK